MLYMRMKLLYISQDAKGTFIIYDWGVEELTQPPGQNLTSLLGFFNVMINHDTPTLPNFQS